MSRGFHEFSVSESRTAISVLQTTTVYVYRVSGTVRLKTMTFYFCPRTVRPSDITAVRYDRR